MQLPFRRAASAPAPAMPMPMLAFPGMSPDRMTVKDEAEAVAATDADLASLLNARGLLVLSSWVAATGGSCGGECDLRKYLREIEAVRRVAPPPPQQHQRQRQQVMFPWHDDAAPGGGWHGKAAAGGHASLETERAVALFALAAEAARAAAAEDRRGADGIRRACAALCDAAGALRAAAEGAARAGEQTPGRMAPACVAMLERMMLAQALECYFELAVAGDKPPSLCSKVAMQVSVDYAQVSTALQSLAAGAARQHAEHHYKPWAAHAQAKAAYFRAEACLRAARALLARGDAGEAVARLRQAVAALHCPLAKAALKKASSPVLRDAAKRLRGEAEQELAAAEGDNCRIYCMRVPTDGALDELPRLPQELVSATPLEKILRQEQGGGAHDAAAAAATANGG